MAAQNGAELLQECMAQYSFRLVQVCPSCNSTAVTPDILNNTMYLNAMTKGVSTLLGDVTFIDIHEIMLTMRIISFSSVYITQRKFSIL